jgi:hypothetical protein
MKLEVFLMGLLVASTLLFWQRQRLRLAARKR